MDPTSTDRKHARACRVLIVDDQALLREGLRVLFETATPHYVVGTAGDAEQAVGLAELLRADIVLIDAALPDGGAFDAGRRILLACIGVQLVFLDEALSHVRAARAIKMGAAGYFVKSESFKRLADGISRISSGQRAFCEEVERRIVSTPTGLELLLPAASAELSSLTPRELEVLEHLARSRSVKETARIMRLAHSTVDNHKTRLMKKLGAHKVADLARAAIRAGLLDE